MATETPVRDQPEAHRALRTAHEAGYRFPDGFFGFSAILAITRGVETWTGHATVGGPRATTIEIDAPDDIQQWARQELASMAGHRWPTPYDQSDGRWILTIADDTADPLGRVVTVHDDPFQSSYRLRDGRISQVNRQMGPMRFTITIQQRTHLGDGRYLPATFTVTYWNTGTNRLDRTDIYTDTYAETDGVWLPSSRRVVTATDSGLEATELIVTGTNLLDHPIEPADVSGERHGTRAG